MDVPALLLRALDTLKINQAGLAKRLSRGQPTVSRWLSGEANPDYESCLRLAMITGIPAPDVLRAAGLDPSLLPEGATFRDGLTPLQRDVLARMARLQALANATEGMPDDFADVYLRKILDNTESQIEATITMVRNLRHSHAAQPVVPVTVEPEELGRHKGDDGHTNRPVSPTRRRYESQSVTAQIERYGLQPMAV